MNASHKKKSSLKTGVALAETLVAQTTDLVSKHQATFSCEQRQAGTLSVICTVQLKSQAHVCIKICDSLIIHMQSSTFSQAESD